MGMLIVVEPIVPAEHLLPGIGEKFLRGSLLGRIHDDFQQGLVRMGGIGRLIRLRHLRSPLPGHIGGDAGRIDTLADLAVDGHDARDMAARPGHDHLVHERGALAESDHFEVSRPAVHIKHFDKDVKIGIRRIFVASRIDDESRPVGRIQQRLERQVLQEPGGAVLVQFRIRIDEECRREVVGAPLRAGFTAIGDRGCRPCRQDEVLQFLPSARLGESTHADRKGKRHQIDPFHFVSLITTDAKIPI